ncbi:cystathionine beta-lyase [Thalassotalea euphylliae]|uniref:Cystathionine beta-lyase n=1 Tax=Thalassotalea euphylliae TaxID=1655234 RepID=A0A3E0TSA6_9GAMM|nr:cystathionine beta-lyase [Thalassotalea euphylliae]REL26805.1 cystathionine beta-lyase [Thalassotalea euphylliae]
MSNPKSPEQSSESNNAPKQDTKIVNAGRSDKWTNGVVNPAVQRASTVVFDSVKQMKHATANKANQVLFYGRRGTSTSFAFSDAMTELEGGVGCALYPSGTAAITNAILAFVKTGDHILMVDTAYEPTRSFCDNILAKMGVETTYYDPVIGADIESLIRENTSLVFLEAPGSLTMEVQDIPAISEVAHRHGCSVLLDNTWASPINLKPFELGVDVSIQAATKYVVGHSDVMLGTATANEAHWPQLRESSYTMGQCTSPDDLYLALRGIRTLGVRMKQHEQSALKIARWLSEREEVETIFHPAFPSCPGHEQFKRDFLGSNGLFSFVVKPEFAKDVTAFLDGMHHFKMGYSWGGFESLILAVQNVGAMRTATDWQYQGPLVRLHVGLEDVDDLIEDLAKGFERLAGKA